MREFVLGLRLLFGSGRGTRVRFALMTLGSSLGVCCLALVLTIPAILDARDGRGSAREPDTHSGKPTQHRTLVLNRSDPHGAKPFHRVFLAQGTRYTPAPPPGLDRLPGPGEVFVSPALHDQLRREPALKGLLPGRERGLISPEGLTDPSELYAYVGTDRSRLLRDDGTRDLRGFGVDYTPSPTVEPSTLDMLRFTLATLVLLPLAVFLSVCARLSAASRNRRLASLRLLGVSARGVRRVNAAETVVAALVGAVLGIGEYVLLNQGMARAGLPGMRWYPDDGALSAGTLAVCLLGAPALAWCTGRLSARSAASNPLATRRTAVPRPPRMWSGLCFVAGLGIVSGYAATGLTDHPAQSVGVHVPLLLAGVLLTGLGLVLMAPLLSHLLARWLARSESLTLSMAMRRNEVEPGSAMRVVTGLVLLVFSASLAQGVLVEESQILRPESPTQEYGLPLERLTAEQQRGIQRIPEVRAHAVVMEARGSGDEQVVSADAVVATCAQFRELVHRAAGCQDGRVTRLVNVNEATEPLADVSRFPLIRDGERTQLTLRVPDRGLRYEGNDPSNLSLPLLVPPERLPEGARPASGTLVVSSSSAPATVRAVLDAIGAVAPTIEVEPVGINVEALQQITVIETLLALGMVLGLVIGVAAFLVAVTDRSVERRPQVIALALLGARARTLRAVQCVQVVLPLAAGLLLAVVAGRLAESAYLVTGGGQVFWDGDGVPLVLAAALGVLLVAALGTLPLVGRRVDPELIRRD
ncbi:ABC transporter permease [Streptomyces sp. NPDC005438]|uniref:ABC transporter permease n=1 Tax=Streptomyces sp. NPDC005438 TaxID=3156880 RepID=UPI0033A0C3F7